jgi:hypothetical protein
VKDDSVRAWRFELDLPVHYRPIGDAHWHEGRTENISRSGVLFRAADILDVDTEVEMRLVLPVEPTAPAIVCRGRVVRTVLPGGDGRRCGLAVAISRYRFRRSKTAA